MYSVLCRIIVPGHSYENNVICILQVNHNNISAGQCQY